MAAEIEELELQRERLAEMTKRRDQLKASLSAEPTAPASATSAAAPQSAAAAASDMDVDETLARVQQSHQALQQQAAQYNQQAAQYVSMTAPQQQPMQQHQQAMPLAPQAFTAPVSMVCAAHSNIAVALVCLCCSCDLSK